MKRKTKHLHFPFLLWEDIKQFGEERNLTFMELFQEAFGLDKLLWEEIKKGNKICVVRESKIIAELSLGEKVNV